MDLGSIEGEIPVLLVLYIVFCVWYGPSRFVGGRAAMKFSLGGQYPEMYLKNVAK